MGLRDSLRRSERINKWALQFSPAGRGGWHDPTEEFECSIEKTSGLTEPLGEEDVRNTADLENWPAGHYRMIGWKENGAMYGPEWKFTIEGDDDGAEEELTAEQKLLKRMDDRLARLEEDGFGQTTDPNEAMGQLFDVAMQRDDVSWQQMMEFVDRWRGPPTDPNEFAGAMVQSQLEAGNQEAAAALLDNWMGTRGGGGDSSLLDLAKDSDLGDLDTDAIKTLGMLKFLDDPRSMTRDMASGLMEADAQAGSPGRSSIEDLFKGDDAQDEPAEADGEASEPSGDVEPDERGEPGIDPAASAADMDVVGGEPEPEAEPTNDDSGAEDATAEDESGAVVEVGTGTPTDTDADVDAAAASESDEATGAATPDGGETTAEAGTVDDVVEDLEEQADAGQPADADEAIRRLSEADADDQGGEEA